GEGQPDPVRSPLPTAAPAPQTPQPDTPAAYRRTYPHPARHTGHTPPPKRPRKITELRTATRAAAMTGGAGRTDPVGQPARDAARTADLKAAPATIESTTVGEEVPDDRARVRLGRRLVGLGAALLATRPGMPA